MLGDFPLPRAFVIGTVGIVVLALLGLGFRSVAQKITGSKCVPAFPFSSERGRLLWNAMICFAISVGSAAILIITIDNPKTTTGARVACAAVTLTFLILALGELAEWRKAKPK
jgi:hypothetical protein